MGPVLAEQVIEVRLEEEDRIVASVSESTLGFMYRHALARERRLRNHRGDLGFDAHEERDLFEAMRLSERLTTVEKNIRRANRRNERLRSEMLRREAGRRPSMDGPAWRCPFCIGGDGWNEEIAGERDSMAGGG